MIKDQPPLLHAAAENGHLHVVRYLIEKLHYNANEKNLFSQTPLHVACQNGHLNIVNYLIGLCNLLARDNIGITPLHQAIKHRQEEVAEFLVKDMKCNPNIQDNKGRTPFYHAVSYKKYSHEDNDNLKKLNYFVNELNCDPLILSKDGSSSLHGAVTGGDLDVVKFLTKVFTAYKVNNLISNHAGISALHVACYKGHAEIVDYISQYYDIIEIFSQQTDNLKQTPLHLAAASGDVKTVKFLIKKAHNLRCRDKGGFTPFHTAAFHGQLDVIKYFISELSMDPKEPTHTDGPVNITSFHIACGRGHEAIVRYLIDLDTGSSSNKSLSFPGLGFAACMGYTSIIKLITEKNYEDISAKMGNDNTALHIAVARNHLDTVKVIVPAFLK